MSALPAPYRSSLRSLAPLVFAGWAVATVAAAVTPASVHPPATAPGALAVWGALGESPRAATMVWWSLARSWVRHDALPAHVLHDGAARIHQLDPTWRTPWVIGGLMLQTQGDRDGAVALLQDAAERFPNDPWFPAAAAVVLRDAGDHDEALQWLQQSRARR